MKPIYKLPEPLLVATQALAAPVYLPFEGGLVEMGHEGRGFAFECEGPRHSVFIEPYWLAERPVTNGEWIEFMADGGYRNSLLWPAEGCATLNDQHRTMPLCWEGHVAPSFHIPGFAQSLERWANTVDRAYLAARYSFG